MDKKISQLDPLDPVLLNAIVPILNPNGTPVTEGITVQKLLKPANISNFVKVVNSQFILKGQVYKNASGNYYPLMGETQTGVRRILDAFQKVGARNIRFWCFDGPISMNQLLYPIGTNLITNGTFEGDTLGGSAAAGWLVAGDTVIANDNAHNGSQSLKQTAAFGSFNQNTVVVPTSINTNYVWSIWMKVQLISGDGSHLPPLLSVDDGVTNVNFKDGGIVGSPNTWQLVQVPFNSGSHTSVRLRITNFGGQNITYIDDVNLCVATTPTLIVKQAALDQLSFILDELRKRGMKAILVYADGVNANYNTPGKFIALSNTAYGTSYPATDGSHIDNIDYFTSASIITLQQQFYASILGLVNTVNGIPLVNDPTVMAHEIGNELRINHAESDVNQENSTNMVFVSNPGGWADVMSSFIYSLDPNHLIGFGDMAHSWQWVGLSVYEDGIYNGTYYGVDWRKLLALPHIDYGDFHVYPNQGDGVHLGLAGGKYWGPKLGYLPTDQGNGFRAQIKEFIDSTHALGKPCIFGELGFVSGTVGDNTLYPLYNRFNAFQAVFQDTFDLPEGGIDMIFIWTLQAGKTSSSYNVALEATGGELVTDNSDDTTIVALIKNYNNKLSGDIVTSNIERNVKYLETVGSFTPIAASGVLPVDPTKGDTILNTPAGNLTINALVVSRIGQVLTFIITTSGVTSYNLTFGSNFKSTGVLATGVVSGKVFTVSFKSDGVNFNEISRTSAM